MSTTEEEQPRGAQKETQNAVTERQQQTKKPMAVHKITDVKPYIKAYIKASNKKAYMPFVYASILCFYVYSFYV